MGSLFFILDRVMARAADKMTNAPRMLYGLGAEEVEWLEYRRGGRGGGGRERERERGGKGREREMEEYAIACNLIFSLSNTVSHTNTKQISKYLIADAGPTGAI
jgi:hypothetical protein